MNSNFPTALSEVLRDEGGFVDHPKDPGGATNKGITIATYRKWIDKDGTAEDLKRITDSQVQKIYRSVYWNAVKGDELPSGVDYAVFDFAVNSGPVRAAKYLQAVLGVAQDGKIGPITLAATKNIDAGDLINALCDRRMAFLKSLKTFDTFGKGWTSRVSRVRKKAIEMAGKPSIIIEPAPHLGPKDNPIPIDLPDDNEPLIPNQSWWQKVVAAIADFFLSLLPKGR